MAADVLVLEAGAEQHARGVERAGSDDHAPPRPNRQLDRPVGHRACYHRAGRG